MIFLKFFLSCNPDSKGNLVPMSKFLKVGEGAASIFRSETLLMRNSWQNIEIVPAGRLTMIPPNVSVTSLLHRWKDWKALLSPLWVAEGEMMLLICKTLDILVVISKNWIQIKSVKWKWICVWKRFSGGALAPTFQDWTHQCIPLLGGRTHKTLQLIAS